MMRHTPWTHVVSERQNGPKYSSLLEADSCDSCGPSLAETRARKMKRSVYGHREEHVCPTDSGQPRQPRAQGVAMDALGLFGESQRRSYHYQARAQSLL